MRERFWDLPLDRLDRAEWEALCDGCGQCCLHKVEDADSGRVWPTNVACKLLDLRTARCSDYANRRRYVPDCVRLTPALAGQLEWLPATCAYRLRADGAPLPGWHPLLSGNPATVRAAGVSVIGRVISETIAGPLEQHIDWGDEEPLEVERVRDEDDD
ncbi:YcgN family cysteine cluster protein [Novosphingobium piscinae]|uniref:YcgN family cysteine cluster protein n=1 Tax=Novosphingobium piscinae TaxID=1507448 RepID=A0A7X1G148_9SPHN|nr:YcgN family cysteine cluster protein [Novosphingobium piscinae]